MTAQTASAANTFNNFAPLAPTDDTFVSSSINVAGQPNSLQDVNVALNLYFTNECPEDTEVVLEGPTGIRVQLWSDAGDCATMASGLSIAFDDAAAGPIPTPQTLVSGIYKPTDIDTNGDAQAGVNNEGVDGQSFPVPNATTLAAFNGTNPNGTWTLFFGDDVAGDFVGVSGGWSLGLGPDAATCGGQAATIVGTAGPDIIFGTAGNDVISASAGDDVVRGLGGDDIICGGDGADKLKGGAGKDTLYGDAGRDKLNGGGSKDRCFGGVDKDAIGCEKAKQK